MIFLFFLIPVFSFSQNVLSLDSLEQQLQKTSGEQKAMTLFELVSGYLRADVKKAQQHFEFAGQLAKVETDPLTLSYLKLAQGAYFARTGLLDSGIYFLTQARTYALKSKSNHALVRVYLALGHAFISSGQPEKGLQNMFEGLQITDKYPDMETEMKLRTNIGWAYLELKQYRNCINYGLDNIGRMEGSGYEWIALYSYNNVAVSYGALGILDSAKYFIDRGIRASEKSSDYQALANGYFILGNIYAEAGKYDLAIDQYLKARPFREKVGNPLFLVSDLYTISELYYKTGEYKKGIEAGTKALQLASQYDLLLKFENTYHSLAQNYEGLKDYNNASKYYRLWALAKDSVYTNANAEAIAEMETRYETEKKEQQLVVQRAELAEQRADLQRTYVIIVALALTLFLIVVIFFLLRNKLKRERELFLREAQIQATIQSQENERRRFARDLHDGMGQLISALRLALHTIHRDTPLETRVAIVNKAENLLNDIHQEIRSIAFNLMPQTLVQNGLVPALKEMAVRLQDTSKVSVRVMSLDIPERLTELLEITLYRIIQEWINNIIKYADASVVEVQLIGYEEEINVLVEDDGKGFDTSVLENSAGNGWKNIKSRINLVKGTFDLDSRPQKKGTSLIIRVPFKIARTAGAVTVGSNTQ
jgi:two-component system, NarL family, sensor kinase